MTDPVIPGWNAQWYAKTAVEVNWNRKDSFCASDGEENAPPSAVTVCATVSLFVQQTVVPGATLGDAGEYAKPEIDTSTSPAWHVSAAERA